MAAGGVIRLALFGSPIRHSLSPRIHRQFANQGAVELEYEAIETPRGGLEEALQALRGTGGLGCNVTLPLKREALQAAAQALGTLGRDEYAGPDHPETVLVAAVDDGVVEGNVRVIRKTYSLGPCGDRLVGLYRRILADSGAGWEPAPAASGTAILNAFLDLPRFRPLRNG